MSTDRPMSPGERPPVVYSDEVRELIASTYYGCIRRQGKTPEEAERVWAGEPITISLRLRWWRRRMRDRLRWK